MNEQLVICNPQRMTGITNINTSQVICPCPSITTIINKTRVNQRNSRRQSTEQLLCLGQGPNHIVLGWCLAVVLSRIKSPFSSLLFRYNSFCLCSCGIPVTITTTPIPLDEADTVAELNNYRSLLEVIGAILLSPLKAA